MNLYTLAKLAGVSVATVSKAFSGSREISDETREHIFSVAKKHGCFDKYNKNKFEKKVIAVICPELISDYYNALTNILDRELTAKGGIMTVSVSNFDGDRERELFAYYTSYCKADGIISVTPKLPIVNPLNIPSVVIGSMQDHDNTDTIRLSIEDAIEDAVRYLKELGHTDIGFAGETLTSRKQLAFQDALRQMGLPVRENRIKVSEARFEQSGILAAEEWLREGNLPTAILAGYDYIAIGIIKTLRHHGVRVPEDVSVIGMDNIALAPYLETSLSSIDAHNDLACRQAVELIMRKLDNPYYHTREDIIIPAKFIPRSSTGPVPLTPPHLYITEKGD